MRPPHPVDPVVLREMLPYLEGSFGNPHSIHQYGREAEAAVELARQRVAELIGADDPTQVFFTSGATESNNWVLRGFRDVAISPYEHSSIFETAQSLGQTILPPDLRPAAKYELISIMAVNNETGGRWDTRCWRESADLIHSDATQALGKIPFDASGFDFASFSAHKLYGAQGGWGSVRQGWPALPAAHRRRPRELISRRHPKRSRDCRLRSRCRTGRRTKGNGNRQSSRFESNRP